MEYPDLTAEIADLLLRLDNSQWVICLGVYNETLILSIRTRRRQGAAGCLIRAIIGDSGTAGGHGAIAGGQIPLKDQDAKQQVHDLTQRFLRQLKVSPNVGGRAVERHSRPEFREGRGDPPGNTTAEAVAGHTDAVAINGVETLQILKTGHKIGHVPISPGIAQQARRLVPVVRG